MYRPSQRDHTRSLLVIIRESQKSQEVLEGERGLDRNRDGVCHQFLNPC